MTTTFSLNCRGQLVGLNEPGVLGILNVTPDSFFSGSRVQQEAELLRRAEQMLLEGALFLDIGGQSTRPGSVRVDAGEELARVLPAIEAIRRNFPLALISIDTYYAKVARAAVEAGAVLVNDVSGGSIDAELIPTVAALKVPYVLMHLKGDPQTMQAEARYDNVVTEVFDALNRRRRELTEAGINDIIIDPGFGFAKTSAHNFRLLQQLSFFHELGCPLLVGISRKATVYRTLGITPEEALNGTTVLHTLALQQGAQLLRVHDVKAAREAIRLHAEVCNAG
ncbi:dihydropteroate synthase [Flaviaesturariibacter flavus]|uniref:dihydropteroate synthase n=1 Tax=Flaviaesturariibacter flavus TaxID=2502780 RepID=A0A4R1BNZ6_9BACT|nr:dihydropteroate synthase [Flaviaesturariibacter flavus]TCJ18965.1 dihydropteroate synthase [Flaviaesturariibacter flavus]